MMSSLALSPSLAAIAVLLLATACSSTRQIEATPPQPAVSADSSVGDAMRTAVLVTMQHGDTRLPEEVTSLRFRVTELAFRRSDGQWLSYDAAVNALTYGEATRDESETLLSTRIPPGRYDSVAVTLTDFYVTYAADAGGPITRARDAPVRLPLDASLRHDRRAHLRLIFEAGASLSRTDDCRWIFAPVLDAVVE